MNTPTPEELAAWKQGIEALGRARIAIQESQRVEGLADIAEKLMAENEKLRRENETLARQVPPAGDPEDVDSIYWNPGNLVVQDHRDGTVIQPDTDNERAKRGLPPFQPDPGPQKLRDRIRHAINCTSAENESDTPDFILADFLMASLDAFDAATRTREKWYGREPKPSEVQLDPPSRFVFTPGKFYRQKAGARTIKVIGEIDTRTWGRCLVAEEAEGNLQPVGMDPENTSGWVECNGWEPDLGEWLGAETVAAIERNDPISIDDLPRVTEAAAR